LQEGEVNLLGGLIQRTFTNQVQGVPGLGDIPLIRFLFSQENKEVNDQEVLVMVTPRVLRLPAPAIAQGSTVPVGSLGGPEAGGGAVEGGGRTFEVPTPEPRPPQ
jgi:general secretion pathway protein D